MTFIFNTLIVIECLLCRYLLFSIYLAFTLYEPASASRFTIVVPVLFTDTLKLLSFTVRLISPVVRTFPYASFT